MKNNIKISFYIYYLFFVNIDSYVLDTYSYPAYEHKKIGMIQTTTTYLPFSNQQSFFSLKNIALITLGSITITTLGYAAYINYKDHFKYKKIRNWIKNYFKMCMLEKINLIEKQIKDHQWLCNEYKKIIQEKIKNEKKDWLFLLTITGIISTIIGIILYNSTDNSTNNNIKLPVYSEKNTINNQNIFINNSNNTTINNSTSFAISLDSIDKNKNKKTQENKIKETMILFADDILSIISKSNYFNLYHNIFLNHIDYLENTCMSVNTKEIKLVLIEIILEIIAERLIAKT